MIKYVECVFRQNNKTHLEGGFNMRSKGKVGKFQAAQGQASLLLIISIHNKIPPQVKSFQNEYGTRPLAQKRNFLESDVVFDENIIIVLIIFYQSNIHCSHNSFHSTNYEMAFRVSISKIKPCERERKRHHHSQENRQTVVGQKHNCML